MASICHALDDSLSDKEKNDILQFPDRLKGLKYSLDIFISTFCIENVFFSQTEIAGICLSGELMGRRTKTVFLLISLFPRYCHKYMIQTLFMLTNKE